MFTKGDKEFTERMRDVVDNPCCERDSFSWVRREVYVIHEPVRVCSTIAAPPWLRYASNGSVNVFVPAPSDSTDEAIISCSTSDAPTKVDSFDSKRISIGMSDVKSLSVL